MLIGILVNFTNTYYRLIAGSSQQMLIVSAPLGYLSLGLLSKIGVAKLSRAENVLIASTATATGCMHVTAGFSALIPALELVLEPADQGPVHLSWVSSVLWSLGVAFFGIILASLLRTQLVMPAAMPWPGAKASANVIKSLHLRVPDQPNVTNAVQQRLRTTMRSAGVASTIVSIYTYVQS
jgi:uncharacterized oligopeptide transporter (OPT) family protein